MRHLQMFLSYQVKIGMKRSTELHVLYEISSLAFIWSDNSNLFWLDSSTKETCGNLLHICSFSPVRIPKCDDVESFPFYEI